MPIRTFDDDLNIISHLDDEPNDVGGLTAAQLKSKFDAAGLALQHYLNHSLIPDLTAANLGFHSSTSVPANTVQDAIENVQDQLSAVVLGQIPDGTITPDKLSGTARTYYQRFDTAHWSAAPSGFSLSIPASVHHLDGSAPIALYQLRMLTGKTAEDYTPATLPEVQRQFIAAVKTANAAGSCPAAPDGHLILTWHQLQYYFLTNTLVSADVAVNQAPALGYNWQNVATLSPSGPVNSLDQLLSAARSPMLGGSANTFNSLFTLDTAVGLHFRRRANTDQQGAAHPFDLFGNMTANTWACLETNVQFNSADRTVTLTSQTPYPGEILLLG